MKALMLVPLLLAAAPAPALAERPGPAIGEEASIPFISRNSITDYKADGDRGLYIRAVTGEWYYAKTASKCARLETADVVGFEASAADKLDKFGALRTQGWRCQLESLVRSDAPPKKQKRG